MRRLPVSFPVFRPAAAARYGTLAAICIWSLSAAIPLTGCLSRSLTGLTIEPVTNTTCIYPGATAQYRAYGSYTEGGHVTETKEITDQVNWSVTFPSLASMNTSGLLTAGVVATGTSNIVASAQGEFGIVHATSNIQVSNSCGTTAARSLSSVAIVPAQATLTDAGDSERPLALGVYSAGSDVANLTNHVTWSSSDTSVATVSASGIIYAVGPGTALITARATTPDGRVITGSQTVVFPAPAQQQ